jgi:hypothetical protein
VKLSSSLRVSEISFIIFVNRKEKKEGEENAGKAVKESQVSKRRRRAGFGK